MNQSQSKPILTQQAILIQKEKLVQQEKLAQKIKQPQKVILPEKDIMYQALVNKDSLYEGVFIVGVKTTGIFCRPTCTARKPKAANVEYFANVKDALNLGYRPCKICYPMQPLGENPQWLKLLLKQVGENPERKLKDQDLRALDIDPVRVRRWFKKHHGMTFQAYTRALRINRAVGLIKQTEKVVDTAFDSGFESLSGFNQAYKKILGLSPSQSKKVQIITLGRILSPLGPMLVGATEQGICLLEFVDRPMLETQLKRLSKGFNAEFISGIHPFFNQLEKELTAYFNGKLQLFDVPLDIQGTQFQQQVWQALQAIPFAQTRTYQQQAEMIGNPKAIRAVAKANGDNRISIIIPCHRVIGKNGLLTGYGGGLWRKQRLLELENNQIESL